MSRAGPLRPSAMGMAAALGVVVLFSGFVLVSKLGLQSAMSPWDLAALRFGVAGGVMAPWVVRHGLLGLGPQRVTVLAGCGGMGFALCAYWGFELAPATHGSALIHGTLPLTTAGVAALLARARPTRGQRGAALAIAAGIGAMLWPALKATGDRQLLGDGLLLAASACWSTFGLLCSRWRLPPLAVAAFVAVTSAVVYLPLYLASGQGRLHSAPLGSILQQALFQGLAIGVGSVLVYSLAVAKAGPVATALAAATVPALTAAGAVVFLGEALQITEVIGIGLITLGVPIGAAGTFGSSRRNASHTR